ncbi:hypothetical protein HK105_200007 [Polyrhizophydium stewartii]|uniref:UBC core domain-containing protein n=1 Tax=Polyrhizophydium stewartii TaxID=2732419 RepID=A0ABR4NK80_9FUNG|nr:hypothetical protein HK105_005739 [Polyrhizophydium stewartii]
MARSPAVKRLMQELAELTKNPSPDFVAEPIEGDMLEWHFTLRGPSEGGFAGGRYHGRLNFPADYPFKPPDITFLTPNGRFEVNKKICLSITGFHPESWRPAWGVRTTLVALISFFPTAGQGAVGALDWTEAERKLQAARSRSWSCPTCGAAMAGALPDESVVPLGHYEVDPEIALNVRDSQTASQDTVNAAGADQPDAAGAPEEDQAQAAMAPNAQGSAAAAAAAAAATNFEPAAPAVPAEAAQTAAVAIEALRPEQAPAPAPAGPRRRAAAPAAPARPAPAQTQAAVAPASETTQYSSLLDALDFAISTVIGMAIVYTLAKLLRLA